MENKMNLPHYVAHYSFHCNSLAKTREAATPVKPKKAAETGQASSATEARNENMVSV